MHRGVLRGTELAGTIAGTMILCAVGVFTAAIVWSVTLGRLSIEVVFFNGSLMVGMGTLALLVAGVLVVRAVWTGETVSSDVTSGPSVTAVVPAYREAETLDRSVGSLLESEYEPLEVLIVTEPEDSETHERARTLTADNDRVGYLVNATPGSKAGAINTAVRSAESAYFGVFDADEEIVPEFVSAGVTALQNGDDVFHGRRVPRLTGPVETLAYCERVVIDSVYAVAEMFGFENCRSGSTMFTQEAFESVGGFDDRLTEDTDFALKCNTAGLSVTQDRSYTNTMEAPHTLSDFWGQRKRWRMGQMQVFHTRIRRLLFDRTDLSAVLSGGGVAASIVLGVIPLVMLAQVGFLLSVGVLSAFVAPAICVTGTVALVWLKDVREGRVGLLSWTLVLAPLVYPGLGLLTVRSIFEYVLTWDGEWYQVTKTGA